MVDVNDKLRIFNLEQEVKHLKDKIDNDVKKEANFIVKNLTGKDLLNMDYFLSEQQRIANQPEQNKKLLVEIRGKIVNLLSNITVEVNYGN